MQYQKYRRGIWLYLLAALSICLAALLWKLPDYPAVWFDEGYKVNAAVTLAETGVFGTRTAAGFLPFDPGISSGPLDVGAMALSFLLLGESIASARIVFVLFSLLALAAAGLLIRKLYGAVPAVLAGLLLLATPPVQGVSFVNIGRQILGEMPALAFMLVGWLLWAVAITRRRAILAGLAGVVMGIGLLSKIQYGLALAPALGLATVISIWPSGNFRLRSIDFRRLLACLRLTDLAPYLGLILVYVLWTAVSRLVPPPEVRAANSAALWDAIRTNLLTGLWGRSLEMHGWALTVIMLLSAGLSGWVTDADGYPIARLSLGVRWGRASLRLFALFSAIWFSLFSIGWPRYAFAGLMVSLILLGPVLWKVLRWVRDRLPFSARLSNPALLACAALPLLLLSIGASILPVSLAGQNRSAEEMSSYIAVSTPPETTVETWEWELGIHMPLSRLHHPDQAYLFLAIRQQFHDRVPFSLGYDLLGSDPDYLVIGPFGRWANIYPSAEVSKYFSLDKVIGEYALYRRRPAD